MATENLISCQYALTFFGEATLTTVGWRSESEFESESSSEDDHDSDTFLARHLIPAASAAIRRYTGRDFTAEAYDEYHDLNQWSEYLVLRHHPVATVSRVTLYPYDPTARQEIAGSEYVVARHGEVRLRPNSTASALFPPGFQSVRVEYAAGGDVPADVQWACGRLVSAMVSAMGREPGLLAERIGDHSLTFESTTLTAIAANPELRAVLDRARNGHVG